MDRTQTANPGSARRLEEITTIFQNLDDPSKFVVNYAPAVRRYFFAIIRNRDEAEEAIQDFLVKILESGFGNVQPERGRFRDYLKTAVRNAALTRLRRSSEPRLDPTRMDPPREPPAATELADREWRDEWRHCVMTRAWRSLETYQNRTPGNLAYTALRLVAEYPQDDIKSLTLRAGATAGTPITPAAFRKQLSRARRVFARLLLEQAAETLCNPSCHEVEEELLDLGLMKYVRDFLPSDWRTLGTLPKLD